MACSIHSSGLATLVAWVTSRNWSAEVLATSAKVIMPAWRNRSAKTGPMPLISVRSSSASVAAAARAAGSAAFALAALACWPFSSTPFFVLALASAVGADVTTGSVAGVLAWASISMATSADP